MCAAKTGEYMSSLLILFNILAPVVFPSMKTSRNLFTSEKERFKLRTMKENGGIFFYLPIYKTK